MNKYSLYLWIHLHINHFTIGDYSSWINNFVCYLQIIGPLEEEEVFNQDDFLLLESIILKTSGERIKSKVQQLGTEEDRYFISHHCICRFSHGSIWSNVFRFLLAFFCKQIDGFLFRASDLVMKVDALLSSQPKAEARVEYGFADDRYRWRCSTCI